jgi:hypothetical protein
VKNAGGLLITGKDCQHVKNAGGLLIAGTNCQHAKNAGGLLIAGTNCQHAKNAGGHAGRPYSAPSFLETAQVHFHTCR